LPTHKGILPAVSFLQYVPVHAPMAAMPVTGLLGWFGWFEDSERYALV